MKKVFGPDSQTQPAHPTFGDRLRFVIWFSALRLGTESAKELSEVIGKGPSQLSKWLKEQPKPEYATIRRIAESVGISPSWLDDPSSPDAKVPELFAEWFEARRRRAAERRQKRA